MKRAVVRAGWDWEVHLTDQPDAASEDDDAEYLGHFPRVEDARRCAEAVNKALETVQPSSSPDDFIEEAT